MAKLYGIGAAVVIVGALFKIQHWPAADLFLILGLSTEAIIFFFSAFEPPHEDPDWSLVYPELATGERAEGDDFKKEDQRSITEQLDDMLESAKIEPELIASLGDGMRSLSDQAKQMGEITGAASATNEYANSLKGASVKVTELSDSYARASESLVGLTAHADAGKSAGESLSKMSTNLTALNEMYELQLRSSREKLEAANQMFAGVGELLTHLQNSVDDTKRYKENIAVLSDNLGKLNTVYGNMLAAMTVR
ncbi:MAG: gliding motility protein GldL [Flavobacteriales bacterium]|nr:gliding motility protein GldL [Flavobacteriales bacterium]MBK6754017.1 gliding motility protein GldL [Flavobacteriales bacterium]MBK7083498.1 gliding motility protein GldL [Flavobacteriales bacterium]MBK7271030.1 gliding motility protein GldL [Flavobacteriales bacterium]MBK9076558.1 gliding motility protein GldL [Flavobacteriales bacterium]